MMKTYIAKGLLDFRMSVEVGGAIIRILFSGGSMSANGVIPSRYSTDNPALQKIIEGSQQYKSGRVQLLNPPKTTGVKQQ